jgi:hypothetical protein
MNCAVAFRLYRLSNSSNEDMTGTRRHVLRTRRSTTAGFLRYGPVFEVSAGVESAFIAALIALGVGQSK